MQNEEGIIRPDSGSRHFLYLKRKWHIVECLSRVLVYINGVETATLENGEEIHLPIEPDSVIELDLQSPSVHNYYDVEIIKTPGIEFGFTWFGSGNIFNYNNIKVHNHSGCRITNKGTELSKRQKLDNKFSIGAIIICVIGLIIIQLSQCHFRIHW